MSTFAENFKALRKASGLTQEAFAKAAGISASAVAMYEAGRRVPGARAAVRIASAFGVPVASLVGDTPFTGPLRTPSPTPPKKDILDDLIDTNLQRLARQHLGKLPPRQVEERKKFFRKVLALLICEQDKEKEAEADGGEES